MKPVSPWERRQMAQTTEITFNGLKHRSMRWNMWLAILAFVVIVGAGFLHNGKLFIAGWVLLFAALIVGKRLARTAVRHHEEHGLRCEKCGQVIELERWDRSEQIPEDQIARCQYCGEPFGTIRRTM